MDNLSTAIFFFVVLLILVVVYALFPGIVTSLTTMKCGAAEGFTTVALNTTTHPACVARDAEAQRLLTEMKVATHGRGPAEDAAMAYEELSLIVQKLLCMDADITSLGAGVYSTMRLPFSTFHDMEPVGSFVGRCLNNAVKQRDIDLTLGKLQDRGEELIGILCHSQLSKANALTTFDGIVKRVAANITPICLREHASMDIPAGVRDPGFYTPAGLSQYGEYQNTAPKFNFN
jgi:hypothetical protein